MIEGLWKDLHAIVNQWLEEHPVLDPDDVVDDLYDYVIEAYGPPF